MSLERLAVMSERDRLATAGVTIKPGVQVAGVLSPLESSFLLHVCLCLCRQPGHVRTCVYICFKVAWTYKLSSFPCNNVRSIDSWPPCMQRKKARVTQEKHRSSIRADSICFLSRLGELILAYVVGLFPSPYSDTAAAFTFPSVVFLLQSS